MKKAAAGKSWYQEWFDTPFYHLLYKDRNAKEAQQFIDKLCSELPLQEDWHCLDLACGRGRHARYLHQKGMEVTGLDLSKSNIEYARRYAGPRLHFQLGDMREDYGKNRFHCLLNLFTSFGYFDDIDDNLRACRQMQRALKPGGILLLDFMNVERVRLGLVELEYRQVDDMTFKIERSIRDERVIKGIEFNYNDRYYHYEERVQMLNRKDFEQLFAQSGLQLEACYGNYNLDPFSERDSARLILKARA